MLRPLGNRLIIKPEPADTQSQAGIIFPETYGKPPAMSGEVVSVGRGPACAHRVRQATIAHCLKLLDEIAEQVPAAALRGEVEDAFARYAVTGTQFNEVATGDYVCFAYTAGHNMQIDGESYIVIDEQDLQAVWKTDKESAA